MIDSLNAQFQQLLVKNSSFLQRNPPPDYPIVRVLVPDHLKSPQLIDWTFGDVNDDIGCRSIIGCLFRFAPPKACVQETSPVILLENFLLNRLPGFGFERVVGNPANQAT